MTAKQLGKRLLQIVIVALGISFLTFMITYLAPGDPVRTMYAAAGIMPSEEIIQQTREAMGLNRPMLIQYFDWLSHCFRDNFGTSYPGAAIFLVVVVFNLLGDALRDVLDPRDE